MNQTAKTSAFDKQVKRRFDNRQLDHVVGASHRMRTGCTISNPFGSETCNKQLGGSAILKIINAQLPRDERLTARSARDVVGLTPRERENKLGRGGPTLAVPLNRREGLIVFDALRQSVNPQLTLPVGTC